MQKNCWVIAMLCTLVAFAACADAHNNRFEPNKITSRRLKQVTSAPSVASNNLDDFISSLSNIPGFAPLQNLLTPETPPPEVEYVLAPVAPSPPPLAEYILVPYPAAPAPAPQHANQPPPSPAKSLPPPTSPVHSPPPPPPPPPPSPSTVPETAKSPSPSFSSSPSPSPSPSPTSSPTSSPSPSPEAHPAPAAASPAATTAPVSAAGLFNLKGAASGKACQSIWQVIGQDPDLSTWVALLNGKGLGGTFNSTTSQITMFAPVNAAFTSNMFQGDAGTNGAKDLSDLLNSRPDAVNPIIGYNILPASVNLAGMTPGKSLDTTDTAKSGNTVQGVPETLVVNVTSNSGTSAMLKGIGNSVNILQGDIPACGPSFIHITDGALLPLVFAQAPSTAPAAATSG